MATPDEMLQEMRNELIRLNQRQLESDHTVRQMGGTVQEALGRAERVEEKRASVVRLVKRLADPDIVDGKGVGQPFKYTGRKDQDFSEWSYKMSTFVMGKYGERIDKVMKWAVGKKKTIVGIADDNDDRRAAYDEAFDEFLTEDSIADMNKIIANLC
eukprot:16388355-Heterocapsa_arctica.AAC.1